MHEIGLVEDAPVQDRLLGVPHEDLGGLREACQQLVGRLRGVYQRRPGPRRPFVDAVHPSVELVEPGVREPGFVEVQHVDDTVEVRLDLLGVVDDAVVGALGQGEEAGSDVRVGDEGMGGDLRRDRLRAELASRDRPDDPGTVAGGPQVDRDRAGEDDRVQDGLVAVAVDEDHVARAHRRVPHHLVRGGGAVGDEEEVIGAEGLGGPGLGLRDGSSVVEELSELLDGVAHVRAQQVLAEEPVEDGAGRRFEEGRTAGVARAVPRVGAVVGVLHERAEEGRRQALDVARGLPVDDPGDELRRVLVCVDDPLDLGEDLGRQAAGRELLAVEEDGDLRAPVSDGADEGEQRVCALAVMRIGARGRSGVPLSGVRTLGGGVSAREAVDDEEQPRRGREQPGGLVRRDLGDRGPQAPQGLLDRLEGIAVIGGTRRLVGDDGESEVLLAHGIP